jgi:hypothetical protein
VTADLPALLAYGQIGSPRQVSTTVSTASVTGFVTGCNGGGA